METKFQTSDQNHILANINKNAIIHLFQIINNCCFWVQWIGMADKDEELEMPRDAKIVKSLLKSMGVEDYEPHVIHKFLELWYRYAVDVLTDAQVYSEHAGKFEIDCDDVKLAIQSRLNFSFSQPPPREVILVICHFLIFSTNGKILCC